MLALVLVALPAPASNGLRQPGAATAGSCETDAAKVTTALDDESTASAAFISITQTGIWF